MYITELAVGTDVYHEVGLKTIPHAQEARCHRVQYFIFFEFVTVMF